ncbi:MAG: hypothetical protein AAF442_00040 [Pseudomonadota bacterium]
MALNIKHLSAMASADGQHWWQYKTKDDISDIEGSDYFNGASHMVKPDDLIFALANDGFSINRVKANTGGVVSLQGEDIEST